MKQRDLLFAGLMLLAAPAFAQDGPDFDESRDAKLVFSQTFEGNWEEWSTKGVDTIYQVEYYKNDGKSNSNSLKPWENPSQWQKGIFRDTTIILRNGVVVTDDASETWREKDATAGTIITDAGQEKTDRVAAMKAFGEADGGGNSYFKFTTDTAPKVGSTNSYSSGRAARYRRNLFVRGLDVQDNNSYRLTFYVKGKARTGHSDIQPFMVADVMRGYFHAEKPFSMGYINDSKNYQYTRKFEYEKDVFSGEWEKCTFMTYYLTDSIANYYVFVDGYWWAEDSAWFWAKGYKGNNTGNDLYYHVQPDKFFVRLGFSTDYSEFCVDNLSLTRSTIAGVEYYQHMLRVDFGYQTNLKDLARAAYAKTKIDAVEIPGEYFDVWGQKADGTWEYTDIASAEYQGDGYMYLFADGYTNKDGEFIRYTFNNYKKVLVTFINPKEEELQLKYNGNLFPKATDIEWIKKGKIVENFYNEEAHANPYVFSGVYSMYDRPPVMQKAQYEDGSFGLSGDIREIKLKFSREMAIDNPANAEQREKCIVYVNDEIWDRTWTESDSMLTLTRPAKYTTPLSGDYLIEINNLYIPNTQRKADDVAIHYNFGTVNRDLSSLSIGDAFWNAKFYDKTINKGNAQLQPAGTAALYYSGWRAPYTANLEIGDGSTKKTAARLYFYTDPDTKYPTALCLSQRGNSSPASLYLGYGDGYEINLANGSYIVKFAAASVNKSIPMKVYAIPYNSDPRLIEAADRILIGEHTFTSNFAESIRNDEASVIDTLMTPMQFGFSIEKSGRYMIEIQVSGGATGYGENYHGIMIGDVELYKSPVCYNPIKALNDAVDAAQARVALASGAKYEGDALTALNAKINDYKIGGTFSSTLPADWLAAAQATIDATSVMKLRMDTVDLVVAKAGEVAKKLTDAASENANWAQLIDYATLTRIKGVYDAYVYSSKTNADLTAFIKEMDDAIKTLDARIADTKTFNVAKADAKALVDAKKKESFTEYGDLKDTYEEYADFDTLQSTDADLKAAYDAISGAAFAYKYAIGISEIGTRRVQELAALATKLGSTVADTAAIQQRLADLRTDDDYLAEVFKAAIKAALYEKGKAVASEDLSAFIKNYYLYATPVVTEMLDKNQTDNRGDFNYDAEKHGNANVVRTNHKWNKVEIWMTMTNYDFTDLMPGWTFKSVNDGNGNDMVYADSLGKNTNLQNAAAVPVFDGAISMDWGSEAQLSSKVVGLPAGEYELGLDVRSNYSYDQKSSKGTGSLEVKCDTLTASVDIITGYLDEATYTLQPIDSLPGQFDTIAIKNDHKNDTTVYTKVDFSVIDGKSLYINASVKTGNGAAQADNFKLTYKPSATFDYAAAVEAAKADVVRIITVVDFNKASKSNVEFYTLGGLKVDGAKAGQILIRKTTNANGKVSFDKVLLK